MLVFFFKQKTSYEVRIRDWSSDVCSSDLAFRSLTKRLWNGPAGHRLNTAEPEGGELAGQDVVRMSGKGLPPVLDTAGPQADPIATLSWVLIVVGGGDPPHHPRRARHRPVRRRVATQVCGGEDGDHQRHSVSRRHPYRPAYLRPWPHRWPRPDRGRRPRPHPQIGRAHV